MSGTAAARSSSAGSRSPSPISIRSSKRALSAASDESSQSSKRRPLREHSPTSDLDETSLLGASRLYIGSTPFSPESEPAAEVNEDENEDGDAAMSPAASEDEDTVGTTYPVAATRDGPDGAAQLEIINGMKQDATTDMAQGQSWFLVSRSWLRRWQTACSGVAESKEDDTPIALDQVGPVDNRDILVDGELKQPVEVGRDVEILPQSAWDYLVQWFGCEQAPIERTVVSSGGYGSERVEFYPPRFHLLQLLPSSSSSTNVSVPSHPSPPTTTLPSDSPLSDLKAFARREFDLDVDRPIRLWRLPQPESADRPDLEGPAFVHAEKIQAGGSELIETPGMTDMVTLNDALLADPETRLAVEQQLADGKWIIDSEAIKSMPSLVIQPAEQDSASSSNGDAQVTSSPEKRKSHGLFSGGGGWLESLSGKGHSHGAATGEKRHHHMNFLHSRSKSRDGVRTITPTQIGPSSVPPTAPAAAGIAGALTRHRANQDGRQRGLTGLNNLGNTCFMNSALQCMSNTKELQEYFTSGVYKDEINRDNPLGMHGQVAEAFGQLIERLWASSGNSVAPREFKQALSRFAPQFSGYGQQDTQELLAFLLDGVHEDLNRIKKKPATNAPDWEGGGDKELVELARTCWDQYRSRNDSVIVDLFQGQYRSTVVCPECDRVSITFDPFMYVTTNLPVVKKWTGRVFFVPLDSAKPRYSIELEVPKTGTLATLKSAVGKLVNCDPKRMVVTEEWKSKFYKAWYDDDMISEVNTNNDKIIIFEVDGPAPSGRRYVGKGKTRAVPEGAPIVLTVYHRKAQKQARGLGRGSFGGSMDEYFGSPFLVSLTAEEATTTLGVSKAIAKQYARVTTWGDEIVEAAVLQKAPQPNPSTSTSAAAVVPPGPAESPASMDVDADSAAPSTGTGMVMPPPPAVIPESLLHSSNTTAPPRPAEESASHPLVYTLYVSRTPKPAGEVFIEGDTGQLLPLTSRLPSASLPDTDMFAGASTSSARMHVPGSFPTNDDDSSMSSEADTENASAPSTAATVPSPSEPDTVEAKESVTSELPRPRPSKPLVRTGDIIVADWEPAAMTYYFGDKGAGDKSTWDQVEQILDPALAEERNRPKGAPRKVITIQDCLTEFTKEERLGENDTWYCSTCKKHQQATKKVELWKVPDILVFAFKRFGSGRYTRDKIDDFVSFPLEDFDMEPFVEGAKVERRLAGNSGDEDPESLVYDLYAVDNHYGGMGGGHYTAYAKNHENSKWYDFDDGRVSEIKGPESVITKAAYLVMYRRRTTRPIGAKTRELIDSAIHSRAVSRSTSEAGGPPPVVSTPNSPFGSTDNLLALNQTHAAEGRRSLLDGHTTTDMDDSESDFDMFASTTVRADRGFQGMFPMKRCSPSSGENSDVEAEAGSLPSYSRPSTPPDDYFLRSPFEHVETMELGGEQVEPETVEVKLNDEEPSTIEDVE